MKKLLLTLLLGVITASSLQAQFLRYRDEVFQNVTKHVGNPQVGTARNKGIAYGFPPRKFGGTSGPSDSIRCHIYEPTGDTVSRRPVILLAGNTAGLGAPFADASFPVPSGTVDDLWLVDAATSFAKRGYVVVAFTYRLGWNPLDANPTKSIIEAVFRGVQDLKALVRYMKYTAKSLGNPYRIDTTKIAAGGSVFAGYLAVNATFVDDPNELIFPTLIDPSTNTSYLDADVLTLTGTGTIDTLVGLEGFSALPAVVAAGTSSDFDVVLNFGGAVPDTTFFNRGKRRPILAAHSVNDGNTPYTFGTVFANTGGATPAAIIDVHGSYNMLEHADRLGMNDGLKPDFAGGTATEPFPGLRPFFFPRNRAYEPWAARPVGTSGWTQARADSNALNLDTLKKFLAPRLKKLFNLPDVNFVTSVDPRANISNLVTVYPNPASDRVQLTMTEGTIHDALLLDVQGRMVRRYDALQGRSHELDIFTVSPGTYVLQVNTSRGPVVKTIVKQ